MASALISWGFFSCSVLCGCCCHLLEIPMVSGHTAQTIYLMAVIALAAPKLFSSFNFI